MSAAVALTIAGSDPSGGAGIQADLKTFSALGVYGTSVITALTAQNTHGVSAARYVEPAFLAEQLRALVEDVRIDAIKIGMLGTSELVATVGAFLGSCQVASVVLDPVMVATSGDALAEPESVTGLRGLLPGAGLVTPNLAEAAALLGEPVAADLAAMHRQAAALVGLGAPMALVKGGHLGEAAVDVWCDGQRTTEFRAERIDTRNTHGTGCSLSSAIAALRARGLDWAEAIAQAKTWLSGAIAAADRLGIGSGNGPVHHFHQWW